MANKTLRILIADAHPCQRLQLERLLNGSLLPDCPGGALKSCSAWCSAPCSPSTCCWQYRAGQPRWVDLARFCRVSTQIQHALLYHSSQLKVPAVPPAERQAVSLSLPQAPDIEALETFMAIIDTPVLVGRCRCRIPWPATEPATAAAQFAHTVFNR